MIYIRQGDRAKELQFESPSGQILKYQVYMPGTI